MPENNINNMPNNNEGQNNNQGGGITPPGGGIHYEKIEIPKEYYDKLAEEEHEKAMQEQKEQQQEKDNKEANARLSKIGIAAIFNCLIIMVLLHVAYKIKDIAMLAIPIVAVVGTIFASIKSKKESTYHTSVLIGGMIGAVVSYVLSMVKKGEADYWMHFAISCAIAAFVSYIICSIVHNIIANRENIKALGFIGIILFFAAIIGVPYYFYQKNPEEIYKIIFMKTTEVKAETEFEFIVKTLKNRYGIDFECQSTKYKSNVQKGRRLTQRTCTPIKNSEVRVTVKSLTYKEEKNQYIIMDDYLDIMKLNDFRSTHSKAIMSLTGSTITNFYIYPKENCTFIGDCAQCQEYFDNYENEINVDKQYEASSKLNHESYLNLDAKDIVNSGEFKYVIDIIGIYGPTVDLDGLVNTVLTYLNNQGLKNKFGFQITIYETNESGDIRKEIYKVTGDASSDQVFKEPKVVAKHENNNDNQGN
ncbi:MAG: hypothetical protein II625_06300 [Bacilli bacterium]|nr:hypothetical protein [Bacilli bacterium]